jgi:hypothetical protein
VQARRVQTRAITVTTRASKACADAGDHGEDACKYGVGRRGRARSRRVQVRRGQTRAFKVKKRASKACADAVVERALQALEAAALRTIDAFRAQEVSNTLHIMAKSRYRPWDRAIKVKTHASTECADAVDQGADACKQGVCSRGRSR